MTGVEPSMRQQIEELLEAPVSGAGAPTLARMEETLTDGYARALALDAERWRLERRLHEAAAGELTPGEIASLSRRLGRTRGDLSQLRTLLRSLHGRTRTARNGSRPSR